MNHPLQSGAIANNVSWCATICALHGSKGELTSLLWMNKQKAPPFYPNIITTKPNCELAVLEAVAECRRCGVTGSWGIKDSFGELDLSAHGFIKVIDGNWFACLPPNTETQASADWRTICKSELENWVEAWHGSDGSPPDIFRPELLDSPTVSILARYVQGTIIEGGIVDMSDGVAGLSNWFSAVNNDSMPKGLVATAHAIRQAPVVCWSDAPEPQMAVSGFSSVGPMAVWINQT